MPLYLSWDCANRTLAWCLIRIDTDASAETYEILDGNVADILGEKVKDVDEPTRARKLAEWLSKSPVAANLLQPDIEVIIEKQPERLGRWGGATTHPATAIANQLLFYYCANRCHLIDPKAKNKIALRPDLVFVDNKTATESSRKAARKEHSTSNLLYLKEKYPCNLPNIPKSLLNHVADAAIQAIAFYRKKDIPRPAKQAKRRAAKPKTATPSGQPNDSIKS